MLSAFGLVLVLLGLVGLVSVTRITSLDRAVRGIGTRALPSMVIVKGIDAASMDYRGVQIAYVATSEPARRRALDRQLRSRSAEVAKLFASFGPLIKDPADRTLSQDVKARWAAYVRRTDPAVHGGDAAAATEALDAAKGPRIIKCGIRGLYVKVLGVWWRIGWGARGAVASVGDHRA